MKKKSWLHRLLSKQLPMDDDARRTGAKLQEIGEQASEIGRALTKTITLPILALGEGSRQAAKDFEESFANVARTVDGVSDKFGKLTPKGEALAASFRQMAKEIPLTEQEKEDS